MSFSNISPSPPLSQASLTLLLYTHWFRWGGAPASVLSIRPLESLPYQAHLQPQYGLKLTLRGGKPQGMVLRLQKVLLRKRTVIEPTNDFLKNICQVEHSRHQSVHNFLVNLLAALSAYSFLRPISRPFTVSAMRGLAYTYLTFFTELTFNK
jgi:hypothetical protein